MSRRDLSNTAAIAVVSLIFFTWGGLTSLNDVLIPHLKAVFAMDYAQTMLIHASRTRSSVGRTARPAGALMVRPRHSPATMRIR